MAIVKDERPYLIEWVAWYRLLGFDQIWLYSNDCSDGTDRLLDAMQAAGLITHWRWPSFPNHSIQVYAYVNALHQIQSGHENGADWLLFVDADEFLYLPADRTIQKFLGRFDQDVGAIAINWRLFGSSGELVRRLKPVIERFRLAALRGLDGERHCKTIGRVSMLNAPHVHRVFLKEGRYVDTEGRDIEVVDMGFTPTVEHRLAQVNHYVIKSQEEFLEKKARGIANAKPDDPTRFDTRNGNFFARHDTNDELDLGAYKLLPELKQEMRRIERMLPTEERGKVGLVQRVRDYFSGGSPIRS